MYKFYVWRPLETFLCMYWKKNHNNNKSTSVIQRANNFIAIHQMNGIGLNRESKEAERRPREGETTKNKINENLKKTHTHQSESNTLNLN